MNLDYLKKPETIAEEDTLRLRQTVTEILDRVRKEGDAAIAYYEKKFDDFTPESYRVSSAEAARAADQLPPDIIEELDFAIDHVTKFAEAQMEQLGEFEMEMMPGLTMGHRVVPIESCACYVPAGRYPCLTSAVMSIVPAKVAGVKRIVTCCPPGRDKGISPGILYTLHKMQPTEIYCMGGAQAIAAFAYGTKTIRPVDLIVGPGNKFVTEAKRQVFGHCGIDFLAGPSEVMVIADETGRADFIAADLLAQCEHDPNARAALITTSGDLGREVLKEAEKQLQVLATEEVARASWVRHGEVSVVKTLDECVKYANHYAPEHLEVHCRDSRSLLQHLHSYGSLFLGELTAEVYADKIAGTNHILPTGRAARYSGGLWVGMYLKVITHQETNLDASLKLAHYAETQSKYEKMDAHRNAATIRIANLRR